MARKSLTRHGVLVAESGGASGEICLEVQRCFTVQPRDVGQPPPALWVKQ